MGIELNNVSQILDRVEKASKKELLSNFENIDKKILKVNRKNCIYSCLEGVSFMALFSGATLLFVPNAVVNIVGLSVSTLGLTGVMASRHVIKQTEQQIDDLNEVSEIIQSEIDLREEMENS